MGSADNATLMKPTRRQFIKSIIVGATWLAAGATAFAKASPNTGGIMGKYTEYKTVRVSDNTDMRVYMAYPHTLASSQSPKAKVPGVLVLQEAFGVNAHIRDVTQRIANLGYVAAAPELYHRTGQGFESGYEDTADAMKRMQTVTDAGLEADLHATYDLLKGDPQVDASRIASVGYCMGGSASYMANAILPLKAAVSYYGGGMAKQLARAKDQHAPILLFWGGKDTHIGREKQNAIAEALRGAGKLFIDVEFSDAEHGFFCDARKSYNPVAARESWALFTAFFREHLQG